MNQVIATLALICCVARPLAAQDHAEHQRTPEPSDAQSWTVTTDANVFFGFNYQMRRYFDFAAWESQNWVMGAASRPVGSGRLTLQGMLSLEPATIGRYIYRVDDGSSVDGGGSPQIFQTGESYNQLPLVNYQHPHDLFMGIGATYERPAGRVTYTVGADLVGSPTLGPVPFMHRESAQNNPQVPLSHHMLDSTHITPGVIRGGITASAWTFEGSVFRGAEPDEERYDIEAPRLDSWAARVIWRRGGWEAQASGGHLHHPEWYEPWDQTRLTASLGYRGAIGSRPLVITGAWGRMTKIDAPLHSPSHGGLVEWDLRATGTLASYGRVELVKKEILGVHVHSPDMPPHQQFLSNVAALTLGLVKDLRWFGLDRWGRVGIGGDVTWYDLSSDLEFVYGGSRSFHAFLRWRPPVTGGQQPHVHH